MNFTFWLPLKWLFRDIEVSHSLKLSNQTKPNLANQRIISNTMKQERTFRHFSIVVFFILLVATQLLGSWYHTEVPGVTVTKLITTRDRQTQYTKRKAIVITTFMRSGSTFLGELFNLHPDTFYQFEPLHPFYRSGCQHRLNEKYESLVDRLRCLFHDEYNTTGRFIVFRVKLDDI